MTLINLRGVHAAGRFQVATVLLKVTPLVAIIVIGVIVMGSGNGEIRPLDMREINGVDLRGAAARLES